MDLFERELKEGEQNAERDVKLVKREERVPLLERRKRKKWRKNGAFFIVNET
jgi:hypothetical protein